MPHWYSLDGLRQPATILAQLLTSGRYSKKMWGKFRNIPNPRTGPRQIGALMSTPGKLGPTFSGAKFAEAQFSRAQFATEESVNLGSGKLGGRGGKNYIRW